ncbi:MAG TPA: hypothetical protein DIT40_09365 [Alphaproteobacteria bacterium]|nr:hypothetical protein [Alphaproteobacteria bacterium]
MEAVVTYLARLSRGGVSRKPEELEAETLRFGRATNAEVYLADPRVRLEHAVLHHRPGGIFVEAEEGADIRVNGISVPSRAVDIGDVIAVGPYDITIVEAPEGKDVAIDVELVRPLSDDYEALTARSVTSLAGRGVSKRVWSWGLALAIIALFLIAPIVFFTLHEEPKPRSEIAFRLDQSWDSGPISTAHRFISMQCNVCHEAAFVQVKDEACFTCHEKITHHFDPQAPELAEVGLYQDAAGSACQSCHKEHNGDAAISIMQDSFCADCHADIEADAPKTQLLNASNFEDEHPEFRPLVMLDPVAQRSERISLNEPDKLVERSGLRFPHDVHLKKDGIRGPKGREELVCASCHVSEPSGASFFPIEMEAQCERCHQLKFEPRRPDRVLPHGQVDNAQLLIREFYSDFALRGGAGDSGGKEELIIRRRPGSEPVKQEIVKADPKQWAEQQARKVADQAFGRTMCGTCHEVMTGEGAGPLNWSVVPASVSNRWLPGGRYDHKAHFEIVECENCHAADKSHLATDVLLPKIEICQDCHSGENAADKVPSNCVSCHDYHLDGEPMMKPVASAAWTGPEVPAGQLDAEYATGDNGS